MAGRILKGVWSGNSIVLTTVMGAGVDPDAIDAFLSQNWNHITTTSPFGNMSFHREDTELVAKGLRNLADFIERQVVKDEG